MFGSSLEAHKEDELLPDVLLGAVGCSSQLQRME